MAANRTTKGDSADAYLMGDPAGSLPKGAFTDTTPQTSSNDDTGEYDGLSLHLIVDYEKDQINVIAGTDNVNSGTGVWTFGNYTFTGLVGAQLVVSGAANAGNNGTFAITAVSGHTATTATTGLVTETFGPAVVVYVIRSEAASKPAGNWKIFGANDFAPGPLTVQAGLGNAAAANRYGQPPQAGHFADITALFTTPAAVADAGSQIVVPTNGNIAARHVRAVFTPTGGLGTARVARFGKSWAR